jgi:hypothetical protein
MEKYLKYLGLILDLSLIDSRFLAAAAEAAGVVVSSVRFLKRVNFLSFDMFFFA